MKRATMIVKGGAAAAYVKRAALTEHQEQALVCDYLSANYPQVLYWANINGAQLSGNIKQRSAQVNKLKAEGYLPGLADLTIFEPHGGYSCMFIEMKRADGGSGASDNQMWFLREVEKRGAFGVVCNGFDEAQAVLDDYLSGKTIRQASPHS